MSCFSLPKKLKQLPSSSKKVWNSFTSSLSPKLRHLRHRTRNLPKTLTRTATRLLDPRHKHSRFMTRPPPRGPGRFSYYKQYQYHNYYQHFQPNSSVLNSPATVYVDRLYADSSKEAYVGVTMEASTFRCGSHGGCIGGGSGGGGGGNGNKKRNKMRDKWKEYVSSMPTIKGVDERAEEFISKFRQQISLQREQSIIDFQEMLVRSA